MLAYHELPSLLSVWCKNKCKTTSGSMAVYVKWSSKGNQQNAYKHNIISRPKKKKLFSFIFSWDLATFLIRTHLTSDIFVVYLSKLGHNHTMGMAQEFRHK